MKPVTSHFFPTLLHRLNSPIHFIFTARKLWKDYFASGVDGVVFLVDSVDRVRFPEAKKELDVSSVVCCVFVLLR